MAVPDVLRPLMAAGLTTTIRADGRLVVRPLERITVVIDAHIRAHRDELVAALSVHVPARSPLGWPPPEPEWFAAWTAKDDARRRALIEVGKARLELRRNRRR
jgi:hypothetical protein